MDQFIPEIRAQSDPEKVVLCLRIFQSIETIASASIMLITPSPFISTPDSISAFKNLPSGISTIA